MYQPRIEHIFPSSLAHPSRQDRPIALPLGPETAGNPNTAYSSLPSSPSSLTFTLQSLSSSLSLSLSLSDLSVQLHLPISPHSGVVFSLSRFDTLLFLLVCFFYPPPFRLDRRSVSFPIQPPPTWIDSDLPLLNTPTPRCRIVRPLLLSHDHAYRSLNFLCHACPGWLPARGLCFVHLRSAY